MTSPYTPEELAALPEVLELEEAARLLRLDPRIVGRELRLRKLPGKQIGRTYRFSKTALIRWLSGEGRAAQRRADERA